MPDDRLRLIFTCRHPALGQQSQVELALRLLCGLSTAEVASAFLTAEPTMAKRLVRTKHKIKAANIPYRIPDEHELPDRLQTVLVAIYLMYTTGQGKPKAETDLCSESIRLGRMLRLLMPDEPEVAGLLALMLLTESRRGTRTDELGALVLLRDQNRAGWNRALIGEGHALVRWCLRRNQPGPLPAAGRDRRGTRRRRILRRDRLGTDPHPLRPADGRSPDPGHRPQPSRSPGRGPRTSGRDWRCRHGSTRRLLPIPRRPRGVPAPRGPPRRGGGRLPPRRRTRPTRTRTGLPTSPGPAESRLAIRQDASHVGARPPRATRGKSGRFLVSRSAGAQRNPGEGLDCPSGSEVLLACRPQGVEVIAERRHQFGLVVPGDG